MSSVDDFAKTVNFQDAQTTMNLKSYFRVLIMWEKTGMFSISKFDPFGHSRQVEAESLRALA
ncbi:hypothetical protein AGMMS49982_13640 [Bacteroidia bacterium]|nr:hypothetical protein AGMMS49982_13640 [Bacteroidia bacterium]